MYRVKDVMTEDVISCEPGATLESAVRIMKDPGCGCVPVVDGTSRVVGLVTDRDAVLCALNRGKSLKELRVSEACSRDVICCEANDTVERAEMLMRINQVRRLPVVEDRRILIGVISITDLARHAEMVLSETGTGLSPRQITTVLAATSGVRRPPRQSPANPGREAEPHPISESFFHG